MDDFMEMDSMGSSAPPPPVLSRPRRSPDESAEPSHPRSLSPAAPPRVDRISSLPDELILRVLSFLSLTLAARTSILSSRWRRLWASNPTLDFNYALYASSSAFKSSSRGGSAAFEDWVDRVLILSKSRIETLKISCPNFDADAIGRWASLASERLVEEIRLKYSPRSDYKLPPELSSCKSLILLELKDVSQDAHRLMAFVELASLKFLRLVSVSLDSQLVPTLISCCSHLEELCFRRCRFTGAGASATSLNVTSAVLKTLCVKKCSANQQGPSLNLKVDAPSLVSFRYKGAFGCNYILKNLSSLIVADVNFENAVSESSFSKLLSGLSHAKFLTLSHLELKKEGQPNLLMTMVQQNDLKYLQLKTLHHQDYVQLVVIFLKKFPYLETLIIDVSQVLPDKPQIGPKLKLDYDCTIEHLKILEIHGFDGDKRCFSFLLYVLENASALQKIKLIYQKGLPEFNEQRAMCRMVRKTQKASPQAKVIFSTCF